jgi:reverse transcriptase-like protein
MSDIDKHFRRAVKRIAEYGDTDIFPAPLEKYIFFDHENDITDLLAGMYHRFAKSKKDEVIGEIEDHFSSDSLLSPAGFRGFRWASQIDQFWNAYFLGLVLSIGHDLEQHRLPVCENIVFSYRYNKYIKQTAIFTKGIGWLEFRSQAESHARDNKHRYVLTCDISDFYPRLYHHSLENELQRATKHKQVVFQIMAILSAWSKGVSYGLPVGGDAARLLSELVLNVIDRHLMLKRYTFCRFVDDIILFTSTKAEAYAAWVDISGQLLRSEGLQLQKSKTFIETTGEFLKRQTFEMEADNKERHGVADLRKLMLLKIRFDPYSDTADEDYKKIKEQVQGFDIDTILRRELNKSRIDQALVKKIVKIIQYLRDDVQYPLLTSLLSSSDTVYPILSTILHAAKHLIDESPKPESEEIFRKVRELVISGNHVLRVPMNMLYAIRLLSRDNSIEADTVLANMYQQSDSHAVRRDVILAMARKGATAWLKGIKLNYASIHPWERSAFIAASYVLTDEGQHWRQRHKSNFNDMDQIQARWISKNVQKSGWVIPL